MPTDWKWWLLYAWPLGVIIPFYLGAILHDLWVWRSAWLISKPYPHEEDSVNDR